MASFYESEACFRRYENYITEACLAYPKEVFFRSEDLSINTDTARCRDSITSFRTYKWASSIDPVAYAPVLNQLSVASFMGYVVIVSKARIHLLRRLWRKDAKEGNERADNLVAETLFHAQRVFNSELTRAIEFTRMSGYAAKDVVEETNSAPLISLEEFSKYNIEDAINAINEGKVTHAYVCPWDEDTESRVRNAIGDKLNVAYVVDKLKQQINIF